MIETGKPMDLIDGDLVHKCDCLCKAATAGQPHNNPGAD